MSYDVTIIGGGPAGLAAAIEAYKNLKEKENPKVLIIERNNELGGILLQCIHNGFGSVRFSRDMPGPAYAHEFVQEVKSLPISVLTDTMVTDILPGNRIFAMNDREGYLEIESKAIVLAMGCRERTRAQIRIPGSRPAGVFTAGTVQRFVNIEGFMPGKRFVILGSGDIGMIMARRLTLEGAKVERVLEALPYLTGLRRNYVQCLQDFGIPLELSRSVKRIIGGKRVEAVETAAVNDKMEFIPESEETIPCDTLLLSVGLIPENELSKKAGVRLDPATGGPVVSEKMETTIPGIFAAGNIVHIYDLADWVSEAGVLAGKNAAFYAQGLREKAAKTIRILPGENVRTVVPQSVSLDMLENQSLRLEIRASKLIDSKINVCLSGGPDEYASIPRNYARPAEMIEVGIRGTALLEALQRSGETSEIKVSIR